LTLTFARQKSRLNPPAKTRALHENYTRILGEIFSGSFCLCSLKIFWPNFRHFVSKIPFQKITITRVSGLNFFKQIEIKNIFAKLFIIKKNIIFQKLYMNTQIETHENYEFNKV
jgi:hypothetical protein